MKRILLVLLLVLAACTAQEQMEPETAPTPNATPEVAPEANDTVPLPLEEGLGIENADRAEEVMEAIERARIYPTSEVIRPGDEYEFGYALRAELAYRTIEFTEARDKRGSSIQLTDVDAMEWILSPPGQYVDGESPLKRAITVHVPQDAEEGLYTYTVRFYEDDQEDDAFASESFTLRVE